MGFGLVAILGIPRTICGVIPLGPLSYLSMDSKYSHGLLLPDISFIANLVAIVDTSMLCNLLGKPMEHIEHSSSKAPADSLVFAIYADVSMFPDFVPHFIDVCGPFP